MRPSEALQVYRKQIRSVVIAHNATNVRVFGSVVRGEDTDESDLDLLIDPTPESPLMDIGAIRHEIKDLLGIDADILTPNALSDAFREQILRESIPV